MATSHLEKLFSDLLTSQQSSVNSLPPVHLWNPSLSGDIDIVIDREGRWIHEGSEIKRDKLVKLFASILVREGEQYFLLTPFEKWRIKVDVAPLFIIAASREQRDGQQAITLTTSTGDSLVVGKQHPLSLVAHSGESLPQVIVRNNLPALISRNVYYQLIDWALEAAGSNTDSLFIESMGEQFLLGES
ncbi:MAG: DUF1285 domain-containing protein [Porticoccaceae bacterium]